MAITDFGTVRCYSDAEGVDIYFAKGDDVTKAKVKELKGNWNSNTKRWRIVARFARKDSEQIVAEIGRAIEDAAPEWWKKALPTLSSHACVTRKYLLKIGIAGMRIDLPAGHPARYVFETKVPGASADGRSWMVPPSGVNTKEAKEAIKRVLEEDKAAFADAAKFIGQRLIAGPLAASAADVARIGIAPGALVPADLSFFSKADPEMHVDELQEWCLRVVRMEPDEGGFQVLLQYADLGTAFRFLRERRANPSPSAALGFSHARARFERQKPGRT